MNYYSFCVSGASDNDLIVGILSQWPFESFMEEKQGLCAYLPKSLYHKGLEKEVRRKISAMGLEVIVEEIEAQNWNARWEENFKPVYVDDFCCIRADFHKQTRKTHHSIIINPKMAFGTGHHETTWMMIQAMRKLPFPGQRVFDYGTGTGILAILAVKMGAKWVDAVDNDPLAVENAIENTRINGADNVSIQKAELSEFSFSASYDIVLANINVMVLRADADLLIEYVNHGGFLLISGILEEQSEQTMNQYLKLGLQLRNRYQKGNWVCLEFIRKK